MTLLKTTLTLPICALLMTTSLSTFADPPPKSEELNVEITVGHTMIDFTKKNTKSKASNSNDPIKLDKDGCVILPTKTAGCGKGKGR